MRAGDRKQDINKYGPYYYHDFLVCTTVQLMNEVTKIKITEKKGKQVVLQYQRPSSSWLVT